MSTELDLDELDREELIEYAKARARDRNYWHKVATKSKDQRDAALARIENLLKAGEVQHGVIDKCEARIAELEADMKTVVEVTRRTLETSSRKQQEVEARIAEAAKVCAELWEIGAISINGDIALCRALGLNEGEHDD